MAAAHRQLIVRDGKLQLDFTVRFGRDIGHCDLKLRKCAV